MESQGRRIFSAERRMLELKSKQTGGAVPASGGGVTLEEVAALFNRFSAEMRQEIAEAMQHAAGGTAPKQDQAQEAMIAKIEAERDISQEELNMLKTEIRALYRCIEETKGEVAALYKSSGDSGRLSLVKSELDAIVADTENATGAILDSIEQIDERAHTLRAQSNDSNVQHLADEVSEIATKVFELCNFQDLTGQRITKVINTLKYIEEKINGIISIWGREEMEKMMAPADGAPLKGADGLDRMINQSRKVVERVSQDDIDKMFD